MRVSSETKEALQKLAEADHRTLSQYIVVLFEEHIKRAGKRKTRKAK